MSLLRLSLSVNPFLFPAFSLSSPFFSRLLLIPRVSKVMARPLLRIPTMKRALFRVDAGKGGFIRTTLSPINERTGPRLNVLDVVMVLALVLGAVAVARVFIAH